MPTGNILLMDEDPALRAICSRGLSKAGFAVTKAKAGSETLRRLESGAFDVLLADIHMPEKDGLAFLQEIHALSPDLPVIVLVSALNNQFAVDAADLGAVQFLAKPVDQGLLRRAVSRAVGLKQARQPAPVDPLVGRGQVPVRMNATKAKNQMGQVLDRVMQGEIVLITRHETPKAAVIPMAEFEKLSRMTGERLSTLSRKYDAMLARMQAPAARRGMKAAFEASPKQLAQAALRFARKRG
jgi:two-component system nitrogen regulation response regulator GlnG